MDQSGVTPTNINSNKIEELEKKVQYLYDKLLKDSDIKQKEEESKGLKKSIDEYLGDT